MFNFSKLFLFLSIFSLHCNTNLQYYCTAADAKYFDCLLNLIGSIHNTNFENLGEIAIFDIGLQNEQIKLLNKIEKVKVYDIEKVNDKILTPVLINNSGKYVPGWYSWKPVAIKQALEIYPYILWIDAGSTVLRPLDNLFNYIKSNSYFLATIGDEYDNVNNKYKHSIEWQTIKRLINLFEIEHPARNWILDCEPVMVNLIGFSAAIYEHLVLPFYEFAKDIYNFIDDNTTPEGFGTSRPEQAIFSLLAYIQGRRILRQDYTQKAPMYLDIEQEQIPFYVTWNSQYVNDKIHIYSSRFDLKNLEFYVKQIKYKIRN